MEVVAQFSSALVTAAAVLIVAWLGKERYDARFAAMDARFVAIEGRITRLEEDVREIRSEIAGLRSDITQIALALGARLRPDAS